MKNRFVVTACRFHVKEENKLLIMGWFWENQPNGNRISITLDKKKLPFVIEEKDLGMSELKNKDGMLVTKQYFLWVDLPSNWKQSKKLCVINSHQGIHDISCAVSTQRLKRIGQKVQKYIDKGSANEKGFRISGWYINDGSVNISFTDTEGKKYPVEFKMKKRPDVLRLYPESKAEDVIGFTATYKGDVPKKINVNLKSDTKKSVYTVTLLPSSMEKKLEKLKKGYEKTKVYYHQFGPAETLRKVWFKAVKRDTISYKLWLKTQTPSNDLLLKQQKKQFMYGPKITIVVPLYKTPENYLTEMIESVKRQTYGNWELCLSDGSGQNSPLNSLLKRYEKEEKRIKVVYSDKPLKIAENTNAALDIATGDFIAFADHDDFLAPHALYECVSALNNDKTIDISIQMRIKWI